MFWLRSEQLFELARENRMESAYVTNQMVSVFFSNLRETDRTVCSTDTGSTRDSRAAEIAFRDSLARNLIDKHFRGESVFDDEAIRELANNNGIDLSPADQPAVEARLMREFAAYHARVAESLRRDQRFTSTSVWRRVLDSLGLGPKAPSAGDLDVLSAVERALAATTVAAAPVAGEPTSVRRTGLAGEGGDLVGQRSADRCSTPMNSPAGSVERAPGGSIAAAVDAMTRDGLSSLGSKSPGSFSENWDRFVDDKIDVRKEWKKSRRPELDGTLSIIRWLGFDGPVKNFDAGATAKLRTTFLSLPAEYRQIRQRLSGEQRCELYEISVAAVISEAERIAKSKGQPSYDQVATKTWNKHSSNIRGFFVWLKQSGLLADDHLDPLRHGHVTAKKKGRYGRDERHPYSLEEIRAIFSSPIWQGRKSVAIKTQTGNVVVRDSTYWVPLICAYHGLRREEACQLRVKHVRASHGIVVFDLLAPDLNLKGDDQGGSPRQVPLHRDFIKLGFLEDKIVGRNPEDLLFDDLSNDNAHGTYGSQFGKNFGYYLRELKILSGDAELGVHRFRHSFATLLENTGAKEAYISELTGHVDERRPSERNRYTKQIFIENLKATIDLLHLPIEVPLPGCGGLYFVEGPGRQRTTTEWVGRETRGTTLPATRLKGSKNRLASKSDRSVTRT